MKINKYILGFCAIGLMTMSCTDLQEEVLDGVELKAAAGEYAVNNEDPAPLLKAAYLSHGFLQTTNTALGMTEMTTDALAGPTRGGDWDDGGAWRAFQLHTYDAFHPFIKGVYTNLYTVVNKSDLVIGNSSASTSQKAQARFIRAWGYYNIIDMFGSAAYREIGSDPALDALVWTRAEAYDFVVSELEAIMDDLVVKGPYVASQNAAHFLLAKLYLNEGVFKGTGSANTAKVISHVDAITGVSVAENYWDNFLVDNGDLSKELIWSWENESGGSNNIGLNTFYHMGTHYNQTPDGWNGFIILSDFYDLYDPTDDRIYHWEESTTENNGYNLGMLVGQQYGPGGPDSGEKLKDRLGNDLIFTKSISNLLTIGAELEAGGIRMIKYQPDPGNDGKDGNDPAFFRYADAVLMKAEALARDGDLSGAQTLVRTLANESDTTIASVDDILDVRGRELWLEGWRRNDLIRFGKFLEPNSLKAKTDEKALLFPIPLQALSNPNITQNPGY